MTAEELYEKEFGNADSIPKESVIRLLRHFGKVLDMERNAAQQNPDLGGNIKKFAAQQKSEIKLPTKEAIVQYFNNHFNCHADVIIGDYETTETAMTVDAVLKMIEWLCNQITER